MKLNTGSPVNQKAQLIPKLKLQMPGTTSHFKMKLIRELKLSNRIRFSKDSKVILYYLQNKDNIHST